MATSDYRARGAGRLQQCGLSRPLPSPSKAKDHQWHSEHKDELNKLKKSKGTLKLAPGFINDWNLDIMKMLEVVLRHTWSLHGKRAKNVTNATAGFEEELRLADGGWQRDLVVTMKDSLVDLANLQYMNVPVDDAGHGDLEGRVSDVADYALRYMSQRAVSECIACGGYPQVSILALHPGEGRASEAIQKMRRDWEVIVAAESLSLRSAAVGEILRAIPWLRSTPVRLLFMFLERDGWPADLRHSRDAKDLLLTMHVSLPDSLVDEQIHEKIRDAARSNKNDVVSRDTRYYHAHKHGVLQTRGMPCTKVTNAAIAHSDTSVRRKPMHAVYSSKSHKLPKSCSSMLKPHGKDWVSLKPQGIADSIGAWQWLLHWWPQSQILKAKSVCLSKFVPKLGIVLEGDCGYLALHAGRWGVLAWELDLAMVDDVQGFRYWALTDDGARIKWHFVTDLASCACFEWTAISPATQEHCGIAWRRPQILLRTSGDGATIAEVALTLGTAVTIEDLKQLCVALKIDVGSGRVKLADLATRIAEHIYDSLPEPRRSEMIKAAVAASQKAASNAAEELDEAYATLIDEMLSHDKECVVDGRCLVVKCTDAVRQF